MFMASWIDSTCYVLSKNYMHPVEEFKIRKLVQRCICGLNIYKYKK